jgi:hypothetical protein
MKSDYTNSNSRTKLEWLESAPDAPPKSPEPPQPTASQQATYDGVNAKVAAVKNGDIPRHEVKS